MAFKFFQNENKTQGIANNKVIAGVTDVDPGQPFLQGLLLPWFKNPETSWLDYQCWIETYLDAGMALHKPLPQRTMPIDTLAQAAMDDPKLPTLTSGVNTRSGGGYRDSVQRMASSTYRFVLRGYAVRAGYQIPVPGLKLVAGIVPVPDAKQWSRGNVVVGNYSGIPVFFNEWELWYLVSVPPIKDQTPPANLAEHIRADVQLPPGMQVPYGSVDDNSVPNTPTIKGAAAVVGPLVLTGITGL